MAIQRKGVKTTFYGMSQNYKDSTCGSSSIGDLLSEPIQVSSSIAYSNMIKTFRNNGY